MNNLTTLALEALSIEHDIQFRFNNRHSTSVDDFEIYTFIQTWGSTALGFGGIGGQAITPARTYVFIPQVDGEDYIVYFGGRFAYKVPSSSETFREDLRKGWVEPVYRSGKYTQREAIDGSQ